MNKFLDYAGQEELKGNKNTVALRDYYKLREEFDRDDFSEEENDYCAKHTVFLTKKVCVLGFNPDIKPKNNRKSIEEEIWILRGKQELIGEIRYAFYKMVNDFLNKYPELENESMSLVCKNMRNNNWWDKKIEEYL